MKSEKNLYFSGVITIHWKKVFYTQEGHWATSLIKSFSKWQKWRNESTLCSTWDQFHFPSLTVTFMKNKVCSCERTSIIFNFSASMMKRQKKPIRNSIIFVSCFLLIHSLIPRIIYYLLGSLNLPMESSINIISTLQTQASREPSQISIRLRCSLQRTSTA